MMFGIGRGTHGSTYWEDKIMVKHDILERKLCQIEKSLTKVLMYRSLSYDEFVSHPVARDVVEYNLFIIINCMIDIVNHIVSDDGLGEVDVLSDGFRILADHGYWNNHQTAIYTKMVAFRNMIAHQYADIGAQFVYEIVQHKLDDIRTFKQQIADKIVR
ncbi:type VII toxin-antitoxin system HepT family RNase toxin [Sporomusa carbonis]|uniref:type VII toxin-antitoxin system HepT family RNase toxin n=1 Tax=Sporomusa carbonis TaxID=3076075 RepID=UPI003C7ACAB7